MFMKVKFVLFPLFLLVTYKIGLQRDKEEKEGKEEKIV